MTLIFSLAVKIPIDDRFAMSRDHTHAFGVKDVRERLREKAGESGSDEAGTEPAHD
jgi:hypothetical protein